MKRLSLIKILLILTASLISFRCGTETILLVVAFSATWQVEGDPDHTIELRPDSENMNAHEGIFTGREFHLSDSSLDRNILAGNFKGDQIDFIIQRPLRQEVKFEGFMETTGPVHSSTATRIVLNSGHVVLVPKP